ncbi:mitochondrial inner membrane protease subunit 1-like [Hydractinia symbiolongicarpus]|uniref:mitochondrial inner membrane protease subunit 1-like n=1 Tax=Hydractinia symbiolongicarpus TaxID=13093 RepID=UPI002550BBFA|nr:mitochondrial inner membrane protease subunit 1-like [Hydractinia symbiolongicarpus]
MSKFRQLIKGLGVAIGTGINIFCIGHCAVEYGAEVTFLTGPSMIPTFNKTCSNNVVITEHISTRWDMLEKGDVVISKSPVDPNSFVCKRIAAKAGDKVARGDGMYGQSPNKYIKIPRGHVWLLGDNPDNSTDSREYGPVPLGLMRGRVCFKIWPLNEFGPVK